MASSSHARASSAEATFVLDALRGDAPAAAPAVIDAALAVRDWDAVAALAHRHGVGPWLLRVVSAPEIAGLVPESAVDALRTQAGASTIAALALAQAMEEALLGLEAEGVPVAVLKGPVIAEQFYPDPGLRPYRDIDLLVPLEASERVAALCGRLGYAVAEDHGGTHAAQHGTCETPFETAYVHTRTGLSLDVHYDHLQVGLRPRELDGLWQRSEAWTFQRGRARRPGLNDLFLALAVHLHRHGFERLIWFKDLDLIVRRAGDQLDWRWLDETARAEGVGASLQHTLWLLQRLLGTPLPGEAAALARVSRLHRLLWREQDVIEADERRGRWRRAVQFAPAEGLRGALPSLLLMGRRSDKLRALWRRATRNHKAKLA
ncbi:MAG: nucleotidyltransferase family protein [Dehalococcoidia bacterium]